MTTIICHMAISSVQKYGKHGQNYNDSSEIILKSYFKLLTTSDQTTPNSVTEVFIVTIVHASMWYLVGR